MQPLKIDRYPVVEPFVPLMFRQLLDPWCPVFYCTVLYCLTYGDGATAILAWRIVLPICVDYLYTKHFSVAEFPCQHFHTIFRKDVWHHINWFALFRVTWYDFQEVKWILVSLSDMQQKWDNSSENTWKLNETFSHLNNPIYAISNKFTYL